MGIVAFIPSSAADAARSTASTTPADSASRSAAAAGSSASTMVLSPGSALPRAWTPLMPASSASAKAAASRVEAPVVAAPICRNSVPYSGPAAPPTLDTKAMPTAFSVAPMSSPSMPPSFSTALPMPRAMLVPWSPSPIAVSSFTSSPRCSSMAAANRWIHATMAAWSIVAASSATSDAPPQRRRVDRRVPQADELVVEPQQGDRAPRHLQRRDVVADQAPLDRDAPLLQEVMQLGVDDEHLDQRRAAHAVDHRQDPVARVVGQVLDDRRREALDDLRRGPDRLAEAARLAVDADADLHLVVAEHEARLAGARRDARRQRHAHAAALAVDAPTQVGDLG